MKTPCEVMVESFLPSFRGLIAHELVERKLTQGKIAASLSVTQASVSQYLARPAQHYLDRLRELGLDVTSIEAYVRLLSDQIAESPLEALLTFYSIWRTLMASGKLRHVHMPSLTFSGECDVCTRLFGPAKLDPMRTQALAQLESAVRMLESSLEFPLIMPEVSVNLVACLKGAKTESDVAAVPGRIVKVHDRAKAITKPEFGVSQHMAQVLLAAREFNGEISSAINLRYDKRVDRILRALGIRSVMTMNKEKLGKVSGDIVLAAIRATFRKLGRVSDVVIDEGGPGLEPITYLFGTNARRVVERALEISRRYAR